MAKVVMVVKTHSSAITMASNRLIEARRAVMVASNRFATASNIVVMMMAARNTVMVMAASNTVMVVAASNTVLVIVATNTVVVMVIKRRVKRRKRVRSRMMTIQIHSLLSPI